MHRGRINGIFKSIQKDEGRWTVVSVSEGFRTGCCDGIIKSDGNLCHVCPLCLFRTG